MGRVRSIGATIAAALAVVAIAGCGTEVDPPPAPPAASQPTMSETAMPERDETGMAEQPAVPERLRFTGTTLDGTQFTGESLAGKAAVLWFWAPWCPKCAAEAPTVAEAARDTAGRVSFVGIAAQDEVPAMRDFVGRHGVGDFPHVADEEGAIWQRFGVTYQPAYAFVRPDGTVDVVKQQLSARELTERVNDLAG
ncbi:Thiol-disulfide isomerase or thioredoxin [Amycolatopsis arida]|uniref:Thiol-disulfide isomerase or thioredoxin n=1 Tax=Amycolatopsis arida TaxID=587909 RepID=A0A1I5Q0V6_9PSEU|nr:protein disulfide oxidoreductase [Amycolatopsis arida]TDX98681.1 thiol-disulfide isomerase/thioredoxin [Amycolatopsis arida]SFP39978.1 Thiol-disulfide isomerase or thioredoxin [Amycolatopsis arida]